MREMMLLVMQYILVGFASICSLKIIFAKNRGERLIALMILSGVTLALLALIGVRTEDIYILDVALVYDIFGFLGLLAIARVLPNKRKKQGEDTDDK